MEKAKRIRNSLMLCCWVWLAVAALSIGFGFSARSLHVSAPLIAALVFSVGHSVIEAMIALHKERV